MKQTETSIIIENARFRLTLRKDGIAESLVCLKNGEEMLDSETVLPFCSVAEERPYNNEIKLAHPNKHMSFSANRVRVEGDCLYVGFELIGFEAILRICETPNYITLRLVGFYVPYKAFGELTMDTPPVASMRILQLPFKKRKYFGEWLNAVSDDHVAAGVLATSPYEDIDSYKTPGANVLFATAWQETKLRDTAVALIVSTRDEFLDCIEQMEKDFGLPNGVESRRNPHINRSAIWTSGINPSNVDVYIDLAKRSGLTHILIYYAAIFKTPRGYSGCGNYDECDYKDTYPHGSASLHEMLGKLKAAGITPGFHFLHTHIGIDSRYVTPVADHRLRLKKRLTLAKPLGIDDTTIYVEESLHNAPMHPDCRVLRFGGELISYESYTTEPPYAFKRCVRGHWNTNVCTHEAGQIGGVMDVSEYTATSVYLDQETSLQDEIAQKLAHVYGLGFEFIYFDGSEGTSAPFNIHVSNAQYRVIRQLDAPTLFCEGAAKTHFGWHWMSGGNAFDVFPASVFKEKIVEFPFEEAPRMAQDFTRLNFGWWAFNNTMLPDMYEYGNALAFSYDCPVTVMMNEPTAVLAHPRLKDHLEIFRRWENARAQNIISDEQKIALRNSAQEHTLLINEEGQYELCPYTHIEDAAGGDDRITAYWMTRRGRTYAVLFHNTGNGTMVLPMKADTLTYEESLGGVRLSIESIEDTAAIAIGDKHYLSTDASPEHLIDAIRRAVIQD